MGPMQLQDCHIHEVTMTMIKQSIITTTNTTITTTRMMLETPDPSFIPIKFQPTKWKVTVTLLRQPSCFLTKKKITMKALVILFMSWVLMEGTYLPLCWHLIHFLVTSQNEALIPIHFQIELDEVSMDLLGNMKSQISQDYKKHLRIRVWISGSTVSYTHLTLPTILLV